MSYTPPAYNAVNASWVGAPAYTPPAHNAVNASWVPTAPVGRVAVPSPLGVPSLLGTAVLELIGRIAVPGPMGLPAAVGHAIVTGRAAAASPLGAPAVRARVGASGRAAAPSLLAPPAVVGTVVRYELRGEVRDQGVLVNRRVRAHRRSDGALIAEADTVAGVFVLPVGFVADEYYLVPINLDAAATDFASPCANRVMSVLAMDPV